jgi:TIR domain
MEFDAFISHSSHDKAAADAACALLESAGIRCWVAPRDIRPGEQYGAAIIEAIDRCRVMVLIFSTSANNSNQVHREIERAASKGVPIVPVRIEQVVPTRSMEYFLGAIHWLDAMTPPIEKHLQNLAVTLKAILQADAGARGGSLDNAAYVPPAPSSSQKSDGSAPRHWTAPLRDAANRAGFKNSGPGNRLMLALGGTVCVALLAAGMWFYEKRMGVPAAAVTPASPQPKQAQMLVPELVPIISDRSRAIIRSDYLPAQDHKALAVSLTQIGFISGQPDDETAKAAALENCRKATIAGGRPEQQCELYALGNTVVCTGGRPPLPPEPWLVRNTSVERPFAAGALPLVSDPARSTIAKDYGAAGNFPKALALGPRGSSAYFRNQSGPEEAMRRALEACGSAAGVPCMIVALDDRFVVPIPTMMTVIGFFHVETNPVLASESKDQVARSVGNATTGWNAIAAGAAGRPGLALGAADEQAAIDRALADCSNQDRNCRVIAIGPFSVEAPK